MTNEELAARIQAGEDELILTLWEQVERFVKMKARKWTGYAEYDDLVQQGFLIFHAAAAEYQEQGATFVHFLGQRLPWGWLRWIEETGAAVRVPSFMLQRLRQYDRIRKEYAAEYGCEPSEGDICRAMGVSREQLRLIKETAVKSRIRSLDEPLAGLEGDSVELLEMIPDGSDFAADVLEERQNEQLAAVIWPMVEGLEARQAAVIWRRYRQNKTLKETGEELGVSLERVRQIEQKAMRKLRSDKYANKLRPFLQDAERYDRGIKGVGVEHFKRTWTSATEGAALAIVERYRVQPP